MKTLNQFLIVAAIFSFIGLSLAVFKDGGQELILFFLYAFIGSVVFGFLTGVLDAYFGSRS
jgi:FtsH-binding integral membrane protein